MNDSLALRDSYKNLIFHGKVVTNVDPENLDRIQVSVPQLYDPSLGDLPWVGPMKYSPFGVGASWGVFGAPAIGSDVAIILQQGDPHYPLYIAGIQMTAMAGFISGTNWGFVDPAGNTLNVNLTTKEISFVAVAGVTVNIGGDGSMSVTTSGVTTVTAPTVNINANVNINGNVATNGTLTNNGTNVGSTHVHSGVMSGGSNTSGPQ